MKRFVETRPASLLVIGFMLLSGAKAAAEEIGVAIEPLGPSFSSPFAVQIHARIDNNSFVPLELAPKMTNSELWVDGKPYSHGIDAFGGPPGLSPKSSWEGCLRLSEYIPQGLTPGNHRIQLHVGSAQSDVIRLHISKPRAAGATPEARLKEVRELVRLLSPGILRECVENWFTEKDGGLQTLDQTRYYVDPGIKVVVSYEEAAHEIRLKGHVKVYRENRIAD